MIALLRAELRKLFTTRWFLVTVATTAVLGPISAASNALTPKVSAAELGTPSSIHHILSVAALTSMAMMAAGIAAMAGEFRHNTSITTFLITPRRSAVVIAKLITLSVVGAVVGAIAFGLSVAAAIPALSSKGVHHLAGDTAQMWIGCAFVSALFAALGVAVGALTRSTVAAIVSSIVWAMFVEVAILDTHWPKLGRWLPLGANLAVTRTAGHLGRLLAPGAAALVLVAWIVVICLLALTSSIRRDV